MKTSQIGIDLIKHFESLHDGDLKLVGLQPKMCPAGIWTEGYGRAMRDAKGNFLKGLANKKLAYNNAFINTEARANKALIEDLRAFELIVERRIKVTISQGLFDALVSHVYNTGGSNTIFLMINAKSSVEILKFWWISHYITAKGNTKPLKGLVARRKSETKLF